MKKKLLLAVFLSMQALSGLAQDATDCVDVYESRMGTNCGSANSLSIKYKNSCNQTIDMKVCLQRTNGSWDCGMYSRANPGQGSSYFICNSTGRYQWAGRETGSNLRFNIP